ncbi:MAG: hypothetical protein F6K35_34970 [Okeania sp. SIO2H7]|nr:hypothetical protein [Okeania sp. SIO2H7]
MFQQELQEFVVVCCIRAIGKDPMKLRQKTLIVISTAMASLIVVLFITASMILFYGCQNLEVDYVYLDVARALNLLDDEISNLSVKVKQDRIYALSKKLVDQNKLESNNINKFIDFNSFDNFGINQKLNFLLLLDARGEILFSQEFDGSQQTEILISENLKKYLPIGKNISQQTGIILLPETYLPIADTPISFKIGVSAIGR